LDVTTAKSFRLVTQYFRSIARPLHKLTEKNQSFVWIEECQMAFENLKQALTNTPILAYPRNKDSFILDTDASNTWMPQRLKVFVLLHNISVLFC
jgi:hypothetical protein